METMTNASQVAVEAEMKLSFEPFFLSEYPAIVRDVSIITGDRETAKEIAQEAFARASIRWDRLSRYDRPGAWVRRVAIRLAVRAKARVKTVEYSDVGTKPHELTELQLDVRHAVAMLPPKQKAAVVLHYFYDLNIVEVASVLRCRRSTADVHLHKARVRLAELLTEKEQS